MSILPPSLIVLAGPNGAGKTTAASALLREVLGVVEYVNADIVAQGLAAFDPDRVALSAGRIMMARIKDLGKARRSFAFETTLASRAFAPWISQLVKTGYEFHLVFLWLPSADFAVQRVSDRVRMGGHGVPEETVRRRYAAGLRNFFHLYLPLTASWRMYDNSDVAGMRLIAAGAETDVLQLVDATTWHRIREEYADGG